jgi:hypothetical protein
MAVSRIPAVKAALEALFEAETGSGGTLEGVRIVRGADDVEPAKEAVAVGPARFQHAFAALGRPAVLSETFEIKIAVGTFFEGSRDWSEPEARAWELASAVEDVIRENPKAGGILHFENVSAGEQTYFPADKGKGAQVELTVSGSARINP